MNTGSYGYSVPDGAGYGWICPDCAAEEVPRDADELTGPPQDDGGCYCICCDACSDTAKPPLADRSYGSPYDRGRADSWYRRGRNPHYYPNGTHRPPRIMELTTEQIAEYRAGYASGEADGDHKEW